MRKILLLSLILYTAFSFTDIFAQSQLAITGTVVEKETGEPLIGASVLLLNPADSAMVRGTTSAADGSYVIRRIEPGAYLMKATFLGFRVTSREIEIAKESKHNVNFELEEDPLELDEVRVRAFQTRVEVRGDTTAFNADAYRLNPDATAEDLVRRLPGVTIEDGQVVAQGEEVRRVTVDGSEFFGDDARIALQNLPAEMVGEVQLFDRQSDQAQFTGFRDGNTERTLNIRTRPGMNRGQFGRFFAAGGTDSRYQGGGNYNFFNGSQRVTVLGLTNNINQQNFSGEDLVGLNQGGRGGGGRPGRWGGGAGRDFMVGNQPGINTVHSFGVNYIDKWGEDWDVNASYFFNLTDNTSDSFRERQFFPGSDGEQLYDENSFSTGDNFNHRLNGRITWNVDDRNSFIFTPRFSIQDNSSSGLRESATWVGDTRLNQLNTSSVDNRSSQLGYVTNTNLLWRHRFETTGRTFSANLSANANNRDEERFQITDNFFFDENEFNRVFRDQFNDNRSRDYTLSADFSYTEPIGDQRQLLFSYNPSFSRDLTDRSAFLRTDENAGYDELDPLLSSRYDNQVITQRVTTTFRENFTDNFSLNAGVSYQYTNLSGEQTFPAESTTSRNYHNFLPNVVLTYQASRMNSIRLSYNASTRTPSANQLQNVVDDNNPIQLTSGNPDLDQQLTHNLNARIRSVNPETGRSFFGFLSAGYTLDYIGNATFTTNRDTTLANGVTLRPGSRLVTPENTGNAWNARAFVARGLPLSAIRSNLNFSGGVTWNRNPLLINDEQSTVNSYAMNAGFFMSSNISPNVDFRVSYRGSYSITDNSLTAAIQTGSNTQSRNYYTGRAGAGFNLLPWGRLVLASDLNLTHYSGLGEGFDESIVYLNASIGYKFLENNAAEVRFTVVDIFAQNDSVNRNITDTYIEDVRLNVLSRYALLTFTYNLRSFQQQGEEQRRGPGSFMRRGG